MSIREHTVSATFTKSVGDVAREAGVALSAVRFYEQHGLVHAQRTAGLARRFEADAACRIKVAKVAQRVGMTIREIADVFAGLPPQPAPEDWGVMCSTLIREAEERVAALRLQLDALEGDARLCEIENTAVQR